MSAKRKVIDAIVQSSTIELFASYGIAIAPLTGPPSNAVYDYVGSIPFSINAPSVIRGTLFLYVASSTLQDIERGSAEPHFLRNWLRELTNQLMGRIKNRLGRYQVGLQVGLPSVMDARMLERKNQKGEHAYVFRTLKSDVRVVLVGDVEAAELVFSVSDKSAEEGELILF